jgi:glycosyltransferase involved in cell wall biosynthesis
VTPSISVVIPAFNTERFLGETLQSLLDQTVEDWECVVVDDGSSDETAAVGERFTTSDPRIKVIRTENGGAARARNHGFRATDPRSEFVTFMDSDDVWLPNALEILRERLVRDPAAAGAHGLAELIDEAGRPMAPGSYAKHGRSRLGLEGRRLVLWPAERPTSFEVLINGNVLFPPGLLLTRRTVYERVGRFDERFRVGEDWDMLIRISRVAHLVFVDDVILLYRRHAQNFGAQDVTAQQAWLVRCKAFFSPENDDRETSIARRGWRAYQRMMIAERFQSAVAAFDRREVRAGVLLLARIPMHVLRFVRGYPRPKVVMSSPSWDE